MRAAIADGTVDQPGADQPASASATQRRASHRPLRALASVHRWVGICLSLMFALWFATGAVLLFVPFPVLSTPERLSRLPYIRLHDIRVAPGRAVVASGLSAVSQLRLIQGPDAPLYVITNQAGLTQAVDAASGRPLARITADGAARLAARFSGRSVRRVVGPFAYDQWTVHQHFDPWRPFYRVDLRGADGLELTVSARTADIVQRTTRLQRGWNYVGAVVHWIYPTIIRRSFALWDKLVWCVSLIGVCLAVSGITLGIIRSRRALGRREKSAISPFRGLFRWHHIAGLTVGAFLLTWIFSGWLSMDHGRLFSTGTPTAPQLAAWRGLSLEDAAARVPRSALAALGPVREISLVALGGRIFVVGETGVQAPVIEEWRGATASPVGRLPGTLFEAAARAAWPSVPIRSMRAVAPDDAYEHLVTEPGTARLTRIVLADGASTWVEIDDDTGQIESLLDRSRRLYRWVYYGMHTFDLPFLSSHDTLRKILILGLLACGEGLSLTGLVLGLRRLRRSLPRRTAARTIQPRTIP